MITAIVRFPLSPGTTLDAANALFERSAPQIPRRSWADP